MPLILPDIPETDATPLVRQLLEIIRSQHERIQQLEDEIARLKGLKTRPVIAPSRLETPPRPPPVSAQIQPGSAKRPKTSQLIVTDEVIVPLANVPPEATFKGYEDFVVQDLIIRPQVTCYRRERWLTLDGQTLVATLPVDVIPGSHFGPDLICFILHQYHHQHVTQPLLLEQLLELGIDISAGQLSRILTEKKEPFHQEKDQLLPAGLEVSTYVQVDDTGARHQGRNGYCTHIGNDLFATFESTDSKSRLNFLEVLRGRHTDYVINDVAMAYWERQKLAEVVWEKLGQGGCNFADRPAWDAHLQALEITAERHVRIATEGALLGSLIAHGVSPDAGGPQRRGAAVRRVGPCVLLDSCRTAVGADGSLQRRTPDGDRGRAAADLGVVPGSEGLSPEAGCVAKAGPGGAVRRVVRGADGLPQCRWGAQGDGRSSG